MKKLFNKKIVFAGQRKAEEIKSIIENYGGTYLHRPAQGTVFLNDEQLEKDVRNIISGYFDWIILTTGMGSEALLKKAAEINAEKAFLEELRRLSIGIRGYKTAKFLAGMNLESAVRDDDGSNDGLLRELRKHHFSGKKVAIQLHGERAPKLIEFFKEQGAECVEIQPYLHVPPNEETMKSLVNEILQNDIDAVYFTSKPQGRFLMEFARKIGVAEEVTQAFSEHVVALAVGKVTAQTLKEEGINRLVVPDHERMGSAIVELGKYYEDRKE
ncbi:uroporphyrinogen-III synthase [Metabacillus sp. FJAT-52054]|uniref:Uroporphyrinogen-III synthase n=1 Tax=Metabacillus sediminis TaxID=3117746 RepID=A0ABZ2NEP7_9BACI